LRRSRVTGDVHVERTTYVARVPGPARRKRGQARPWLPIAPRDAARSGAVGHGGRRRARHGCRRMDAAKCDRLPDSTR
jgi:hypothetical protein